MPSQAPESSASLHACSALTLVKMIIGTLRAPVSFPSKIAGLLVSAANDTRRE